MLATLAAITVFQSATSQNVEVPFKIAEDAIIADAVVNGRKASFLFDTGFSGAFVLNETINVGPATGTMTLRDFVGEFQAKTVKLKTLKLGTLDIQLDDAQIVQQPLDHLSAGYNAHTDGIMGLEVVAHNVTEINFEKQKFIFHPKSFDISKMVPDNKKTFLVKMLPMGHNAIELEVLTAKGKRMILALDTGNAFYAATHKDVLQRVDLWSADKKPSFMRTSWIGSGPVASYYMQMPPVSIYGVPVEKSVWSIFDAASSSAEGDGTIGFGFLKNFNITIDMERRRVWLENFTNKVGNEAKADVGISADFDPSTKRVRVFSVMPGSPAEKAGIKRGDFLLSIDGDELFDPSFRKLERLMEGDPGSTVNLAISRDGNLSRYALKREILINGL